ncbi:MAG: hypothetical protein IPM48_08250 [Saprospiraceae bacterium]|nr:hypothetical protein [Saprospiraceae bacterium]
MSFNAKLQSQRYYIIALLVCFNIFGLKAQKDSIGYTAYQLIQDVSNGQILVRLRSEQNKLEALQKLLDRQPIDSRNYMDTKNTIDRVKKERDSFNYYLMAGMKSNFSLCPVYFYYDRDHVELKNHNFRKAIYLDSNLQTNVLPDFRNSTIVIIAQAHTEGQELDAFVFLDQKGQSLPAPWPRHLRLNAFRPVINELSKKNFYKENGEWYAKKLDKKLKKLYRKSLEWKLKNHRWN